jgi:predicted lipoprotein with Yx(FWY)xxD motif
MRPISRLASLSVLAVGVAMIAAACSSAAATPAAMVAGATSMPTSAGPAAMTSITIGSTADPTLGAYLTGQGGMTLYVLTLDTPDTSTCAGTCATNWPPLTVAAGAAVTGPSGAVGTFATIVRSDGTVQLTYDHMPLYYYSGDSKAGDTNGQGKNGTWFVAPLSGSIGTMVPATSPAASPAASAAAAPAASASSAYGY